MKASRNSSEQSKKQKPSQKELIEALADQDTMEWWTELILKRYREGLEYPPWTDERAERWHSSLLLFVEKFIRPELPIPDFHSRTEDGWYWLLVRYQSYINLTARGHGKSSVHSIYYPAWRICMDRNCRIILLSNTAKQAETFLSGISDHLEKNPYIQSYLSHRDAYCDNYGGFIPDLRRGWGIESIEVQRRVADEERPEVVLIEKDKTVLTLGMGSPNPGYHGDVLIFDDVCDDDNSTTEFQAQKTLNWIQDAFSLADDEGQQVIVGTPKTFRDAYVHIKKSPAFKVFESPAILNNEARNLILGQEATSWERLKARKPLQDLILWPEKWAWEKLQAKRDAQTGEGSIQFRRNYLLEVMGAEESFFPREWLKRCFEAEVKMPYRNDGDFSPVVIGVDPALAGGVTASYFACFVLGYRDDSIWWLDIYRGKGRSPSQQKDKIVELHERYGGQIVVESNSVQRYLSDELPSDLTVLTHWTGAKKRSFKEGIPSLSSLAESGGYVIPRGDEHSREVSGWACDEMYYWPRYESDDLLMTLWFATSRMRTLLRRYRRRSRLLTTAMMGERDVPSPSGGTRLPSVNIREALRGGPGEKGLAGLRARQKKNW